MAPSCRAQHNTYMRSCVPYKARLQPQLRPLLALCTSRPPGRPALWLALPPLNALDAQPALPGALLRSHISHVRFSNAPRLPCPPIPQVLVSHDAWVRLRQDMAAANFPVVEQLGLYRAPGWLAALWVYQVRRRRRRRVQPSSLLFFA
jgi:hypothetical protein